MPGIQGEDAELPGPRTWSRRQPATLCRGFHISASPRPLLGGRCAPHPHTHRSQEAGAGFPLPS